MIFIIKATRYIGMLFCVTVLYC